jgi:hypothetical protein
MSNVTSITGKFSMFRYCDNLHTLRLDNCSNDTIDKIINSEGFPTNTIPGVTRRIYCKKENRGTLMPPYPWVFEPID